MTYARKFAGRCLLALGIVGCLLPVIPGIPLLIGAAVLLGPNDPMIRPLLHRLRRPKGRNQQ
jgi:hypothetical protein